LGIQIKIVFGYIKSFLAISAQKFIIFDVFGKELEKNYNFSLHSSKNDKNYRKFRWCRKNLLKNSKNYKKFRLCRKNHPKNNQNYKKIR